MLRAAVCLIFALIRFRRQLQIDNERVERGSRSDTPPEQSSHHPHNTVNLSLPCAMCHGIDASLNYQMSDIDIIESAVKVLLSRWTDTAGELPTHMIHSKLIDQATLIRKSAREVLCSVQDTSDLVATDTVLNAIFDYHFLKIRTFPPRYPASLLDLIMVHCVLFENHIGQISHDIHDMLPVTLRCAQDLMRETLSVLTAFEQYTGYPSDFAEKLKQSAPFTLIPHEDAFLVYVRHKWGSLKRQRLERSVYSPMPWAVLSREDAIALPRATDDCGKFSALN